MRAARFAGDDRLGYRRSATAFPPGVALAMDESYRRAHLPLIAPAHPKVIARWWDRVILRLEVRAHWMLGATGDLVLDAPTIERLPLGDTHG